MLRPLYESSTLLSQRTTLAVGLIDIMHIFSHMIKNCNSCFVVSSQALRQLRQISQEVSQPNVTGWGRRPAALRALGQRLSRLVA